MRLFVYEFVTGGGTLARPDWGLPHGSLLAEGSAMIRALTDDLIRIPGMSVTSMWDARLPVAIDNDVELVTVHDRVGEEAEFTRLAKTCDATLVIAPEIDDELFSRCKQVDDVGGHIMGSSLPFVRLASDKQTTIDVLKAAGIRVPSSEIIRPNTVLTGRSESVIVKPRLGAGSQDLHLIHAGDERINEFATDGSYLLQSFCPGQPASISFLCGSRQLIPLVPFFQNLRENFSYAGGTRITIDQLQERVLRLGRRALEAFDGVRGYIGVDIVLGEMPDGSDDTVIEINPRLTTSYIGNRSCYRQNLAECMMRAHEGKVVELNANENNVSFAPDGRWL